MKKSFLILIGIVLLLFFAITYLKNRPSDQGLRSEAESERSIDKESVRAFWKHFHQATKYRIAGNWQDAVKEYEKALEINEIHEDALYYLGNMYLELSQNYEAEKAWIRLVQHNPYSARAHFQLGNLYLNSADLFNVQKAEGAFKKAMEINKEETGAILKLGQVSLIKGRLEEAQEYFRAVTRSNFKSIEGHYYNGYISWKKGNSRDALMQFNQAVHYAKPAESTSVVSGEGDTKKSVSYKRSVSESFLTQQINQLGDIADDKLETELELLYKELDLYLADLKNKI